MSRRILICNTQVPFVRGGAENLVDGLRDALRARGHTVDSVTIPFAWQPPQRIRESALAWRMVDLTSADGRPVDQVICTKFPSYLVRHPRKVVWLVHQHRQAYDWYGTSMSDFVNTPEYRAVREAVFRMDQRGLGEAQALYTISRNVSQRLYNFNHLHSTPLYPPSLHAERLYAAEYGNYILSPSRLDLSKRLDLLLEALARTSTPVRAIFAGTGDDQQRLEAVATRLNLGQRVTFLGYVDDVTLVDLYARARAVYYAPKDEDYGFAAAEACGAARPVITTSDAGGVLELVVDGVSGYIVPPDPAAIADRLDLLMGDVALASRLGRRGLPLVRDITWDRVVEQLLI